jgi:DNA-binding beta-propeller fold protein YncE
MSHDGQKMATPNVFTGDTTQFDFPSDRIDAILPTSSKLSHPIAVGMMPNADKYYVANLLDSTMTVIDMKEHRVLKTINLIANYNPITGAISGPAGALPIQTPVSPKGNSMVTANMLTGNITIIDTRPDLPTTDTVVAILGCDAGCHGVQYGAKQGGGYYAYVSSKFSNSLIVVDPDPNNDTDPADAAIVGRVLLTANALMAKDASITGNAGMGGQGILPIPVVYNGWVQKLPAVWKNKLAPSQQNP